MEDRGWRMEDGGWRMEDGGWRMEDGGWRGESSLTLAKVRGPSTSLRFAQDDRKGVVYEISAEF